MCSYIVYDKEMVFISNRVKKVILVMLELQVNKALMVVEVHQVLLEQLVRQECLYVQQH